MIDYIKQHTPQAGDLVMYMNSLYIYCGIVFLYEEEEFAHQLLRIINMEACVYTGTENTFKIVKRFDDSV